MPPRPEEPSVASRTRSHSLEYRTLLWLLVLVTLAFGWILLPYYGAVFWAVVTAILFSSVQRRIRVNLKGRDNAAALLTLLIVLFIVILPAALVMSMLVQEAMGVLQRVQSGEINFTRYAEQIYAALPHWLTGLLDRFGLADLAALKARLGERLTAGTQLLASRALSVGQDTFNFLVAFGVMLYLLFFLLRDGVGLAARVRRAIPLDEEDKRALLARFATVIRATVKGNILVALAQGALGSLAFWFLGIHGALLWGVVMAFLSLLPAVGAAMVWAPVAVYLIVTGALWKGVGLIVWGVVVIGLVDNVLRPILVGKDTKMPDYLVLISTLGGLAVFGLNGFVIGPVIAAMFMAAWDIFMERREDGRR
ncbi:AI-2E family transporter [Azohydromonas caseinilytica]|uniref:AI-2E family transporter n=1 Tax=Azohydromonas caseinilytica TaxID=2728836 RepID=A0A848F3M4_9BURK|nr:AI-2E family transporter [Azohydromonas caseinilytica]NML14254.1 AI-2E family transporter [Azohydromonas caseinilytica]